MRLQKRILFPILSLFGLALPYFAYAQAAGYDMIAPLPGLSTGVTLTKYLTEIFRITIGLAGILAVIMLVFCGIRLMTTGSVSGKSEAKECVWNALFGVLLAVGSWLLLNTLNPLLLLNDINIAASLGPAATPGSLGPTIDFMPTEEGSYFRWKDTAGNILNSPRFSSPESCLQVQQQQALAFPGSIVEECFAVAAPTPGSPPPPTTRPTSEPPLPTPPGTGAEIAARTAICGNGDCTGKTSTNVLINNKPCVPDTLDGVVHHCTNVAGLPAGAISFIQTLPALCGCTVYITGGTENGHTSHAANSPIFDLRLNALEGAIKTNATVKNLPSFCTYKNGVKISCHTKWFYNGYWFTDEGDHWHVCQDGTTDPTGKNPGLFLKACTKA